MTKKTVFRKGYSLVGIYKGFLQNMGDELMHHFRSMVIMKIKFATLFFLQ